MEGTTIFTLKSTDIAIIADLMMGGDGRSPSHEIGELQLSAVGEAMNQMIGSASTTMASMLGINIDITPPIVTRQEANTNCLMLKIFTDFLLLQFHLILK